MFVLRFEAKEGGGWFTMGEFGPGDRYGYVTSDKSGGSYEAYVFGINRDENVGEVLLSPNGDVEASEAGEISLAGLELVARLGPGEHLRRELHPPWVAGAMAVRFALYEE